MIGHSRSRMFRDTLESAQFYEDIRQHGVFCVYAAENRVLTDDDASRLYFRMQAIIDEEGAVGLANHVRTAQETLFLHGYVHGTISREDGEQMCQAVAEALPTLTVAENRSLLRPRFPSSRPWFELMSPPFHGRMEFSIGTPGQVTCISETTDHTTYFSGHGSVSFWPLVFHHCRYRSTCPF